MKNNPVLQPCRLKHPTLNNRVRMTAYEPACPEEGMPCRRAIHTQ